MKVGSGDTGDARRRVMVTGSEGGIGRAICVRLKAEWNVVRLDARGGDIAVDVGDAPALQNAIDSAWPLDAIVNAVGIYPSSPLIEMTVGEWDRVQEVNVRSAMIVLAHFGARCLRESRSGVVVNIGSTAAHRVRPGAAHYCASKAALETLTMTAALELGEAVRVNIVHPGYISVNSDVNPVSAEYEHQVSGSPTGRAGRAEDVANAVAWLLGGEASWVNGAAITVDGGAGVGTPLPLLGDGELTDLQRPRPQTETRR